MSASLDEWIKYAVSIDTLMPVLKEHDSIYLPGCGNSVEVVHLKWTSCPPGDYYRATGNGKFPTVPFECVTDNHRILGEFHLQ